MSTLASGRGFEGTETTINSCFYLQFLDADGNVQVICVYGVDDIVTVERSRPPSPQETCSGQATPAAQRGSGPQMLIFHCAAEIDQPRFTA